MDFALLAWILRFGHGFCASGMDSAQLGMDSAQLGMDSAQLGMVSAMGDDRLARKRAINVSLNDELVRQACRGA
jgi:hypothetical protein